MLPASFLAPVFLSAILHSLTVGPELGALPGVLVTHYPTPRPDWKAVVVSFERDCFPIQFLYLVDDKVRISYQRLDRRFNLVQVSPPQSDGGFYFASVSEASKCTSRLVGYQLHVWHVSKAMQISPVPNIPDVSASSFTGFHPQFGGLYWRGNELFFEYLLDSRFQDITFPFPTLVRLRLMGDRASKLEHRFAGLQDFLEEHFASSGEAPGEFGWNCYQQSRWQNQLIARCEPEQVTTIEFREYVIEVSQDGGRFKILSTREEKPQPK